MSSTQNINKVLENQSERSHVEENYQTSHSAQLSIKAKTCGYVYIYMIYIYVFIKKIYI